MPHPEQLQALLANPASWLHRQADGRVSFGTAIPTAIFPGSFNPLHHGHRTLATMASEVLGLPIVYELSVANVDKPPLAHDEVLRRTAQFTDVADVVITHAALIIEKATLFPGSTFVIGADTATRIVEPKYYTDGERGLAVALEGLRQQGCRFFVGGRLDRNGAFIEVEQIAIPSPFRDLFVGVSERQFRVDLSSTELRRSSSKS